MLKFVNCSLRLVHLCLYVNLMYLFTFYIHSYCMFTTVSRSHHIIVTIQKNDVQQFLLRIKNVVQTSLFCCIAYVILSDYWAV